MSVVEPGRLGDRLSVSRAPHPMGVETLYLTIVFVGGGTDHFTVYRLRTISGSRRGWFDVVELSYSRTSSISGLGRPRCQPEEPIHGEWKGASWRSQFALLELPVRRVITLVTSGVGTVKALDYLGRPGRVSQRGPVGTYARQRWNCNRRVRGRPDKVCCRLPTSGVKALSSMWVAAGCSWGSRSGCPGLRGPQRGLWG